MLMDMLNMLEKIRLCVLGSFIKLSEKFTLQGGIDKSLEKKKTLGLAPVPLKFNCLFRG